MIEELERVLRQVDQLSVPEQARIAHLLAAELRHPQGPAPPRGRWADFAARMRREAPLAGRSEEFLRSVRACRDHFDLRGGPGDG